MHAEWQSISLSLRETAPFRPWNPPPVAPESLQGVGISLCDPAFLTLLFPVKASPVSQKLPSTCWVQSPCSLVSWLGKSVVRKRVLSLMCGSGKQQPVVPSWEVMKPQTPKSESRSHHLFLLWPWASYLQSVWLSFLNWRGWWSYSAIMTPFCCLHLDYQKKKKKKKPFLNYTVRFKCPFLPE